MGSVDLPFQHVDFGRGGLRLSIHDLGRSRQRGQEAHHSAAADARAACLQKFVPFHFFLLLLIAPISIMIRFFVIIDPFPAGASPSFAARP
jgi:hypothetical protein